MRDYFSFSSLFVWLSHLSSLSFCLVAKQLLPYLLPSRNRQTWQLVVFGIAGHFVELVDVYRADCKALSFFLLGVKLGSQFP